MAKLWMLCIFLLAVAGADKIIDPLYNYDIFMTQFGRDYKGENKTQHQRIFNQNYAELLRRVQLGQDLGVNQFLDWSQEQLANYLGYKPTAPRLLTSSLPLSNSESLFRPPPSFDWREYGWITPIKRQGTCGGCWSFAAIAQYEALLAIESKGALYDLSQQYGIECETTNSRGCNGGNPIAALKLFNEKGVALQQDYPFKQKSPQFFTNNKDPICTKGANRIKLKSSGHKIQHYENLSIEQLEQILVNHGPVTVGVFSKNPSFLWKKQSGLINFCTQGTPDHAVLLIGYNSTHWFIKNSWGTDWGDKGFGYIQKTNDCALRKYVDVLHFDLKNGATTIEEKDKISMTIRMESTSNKGWQGNILGVRQNNTLISEFGDQFESGLTYRPITVTINSRVEVQIVVIQAGNSTDSIGFTIEIGNQIIYDRRPGQPFATNIIFTTFCPTLNCVTKQTADYYLTLMDEWGDGWDGTTLGFRPAGSIANFTLDTKGRVFGPIKVTFPRFTKVSIHAIVMGQFTQQIGFEIRNSDGRLVASRYQGTQFNGNELIANFCVDCFNLDYVRGEVPTSNIHVIKQKQKKQEKDSSKDKLKDAQTQIRKLKVALFFLGVIASVFFIVSVIFLIKIIRTLSRQKLHVIEIVNQKKSSNHSSESQHTRDSKKEGNQQIFQQSYKGMVKGKDMAVKK